MAAAVAADCPTVVAGPGREPYCKWDQRGLEQGPALVLEFVRGQEFARSLLW